MKNKLIISITFVLACLCFGNLNAAAQKYSTPVLDGTINNEMKVKIQLTFDNDNDDVTAWYYIVNEGVKSKKTLKGTQNFNFDEGTNTITLKEVTPSKDGFWFTGTFDWGSTIISYEGTAIDTFDYEYDFSFEGTNQ